MEDGNTDEGRDWGERERERREEEEDVRQEREPSRAGSKERGMELTSEFAGDVEKTGRHGCKKKERVEGGR